MAIRTLADAETFTFDQVTNPDIVLWDMDESDERDRGVIFATLRTKLVDRLLTCPGRAAFIVDEAVSVTEDELGARTLGDLVHRGRHSTGQRKVAVSRVQCGGFERVSSI